MYKVAGLVGVKELKLFFFKRVVGKPTECFFLADFEIEAHRFFFLFPSPCLLHQSRTDKRKVQHREKPQYTKR